MNGRRLSYTEETDLLYVWQIHFTSFSFVHIKFTLQMFDLFSISNRTYASVRTDILPPS